MLFMFVGFFAFSFFVPYKTVEPIVPHFTDKDIQILRVLGRLKTPGNLSPSIDKVDLIREPRK